MNMRKLLAVALAGGVMACWVIPARAQLSPPPTAEDLLCGPMVRVDAVSPMDYRTDRKMIPVVEGGHFRKHVEDLVKPMFEFFGSDLSYTLHAYPNHHRALVTLMRLGEKEKSDQPKGLPYSIDCFFRRGVRWRPDDVMVRMIYAQFLMSKNRRDDALVQLKVAQEFAGENPFTHYNLGRLLLEAKAYDLAVTHARRAAELGFERADLKDDLVRLGKWPTAAGEAGSSAASAPR